MIVAELLVFAVGGWQIERGKPISVEIGKEMSYFGENKCHDWMFLDTQWNRRSAVCPAERRYHIIMYGLCMYYSCLHVGYVLVMNL